MTKRLFVSTSLLFACLASGESPLSNVGPGAAGLNVSAAEERTFSVTCDAEAAPKAIGKAFKVALRMKSGEVQVPADSKDLEEKFERISQGSIAK